MSAPTFNTRHKLTGLLQRLTETQIASFKDVLEIVPDDAKPYVPGMFKPGEVSPQEDPPTDAVANAEAAYQAALDEGHAPNSGLVRELKAQLVAAEEQAAFDAELASEANEALQNGEPIPAAETPEGDD